MAIFGLNGRNPEHLEHVPKTVMLAPERSRMPRRCIQCAGCTMAKNTFRVGVVTTNDISIL